MSAPLPGSSPGHPAEERPPTRLGVFDSGVGGLTVVREILRLSPGERILYLGDTAHVPYGGRSPEQVRRFSLAISRYLTEHRQVDCVVIACNTATSAAAEATRESVSVPVVAMEPGIKPAAACTRTGVVGVLATAGTLSGDRFARLLERHASGVTVLTQPCQGWVEAIEAGELHTPATRALVYRSIAPLLERQADTLVLGCTHYPLLRPLIAEVAGPEVTIIDTGPAVARRVAAVAPRPLSSPSRQGIPAACIELLCTGDPIAFGQAASAILSAGTEGENVLLLPPRQIFWKDGELHHHATD